ncbi:DNA helicase [Bacteroidia bacterium]|nr:DNA helicase [Bacteroidia bacterium]
MNSGKLTIYSASAGSGKTYNISKEYIKLLLTERDYHRRILAVTFTNKATEEMKMRIIKDLHEISIGKNADFLRTLSLETKKTEQYVVNRSKECLAALLHDYSHFSILTIDSFFQRVIRAFAHEMGLPAAYDLELDQTSVLDEAIDSMVDHLDENSFLRKWLVEWAEHKIEDGKTWNFKFDIHKLGNELFAEELKQLDEVMLQKITDKGRIDLFRDKLKKMKDDYLDQLQAFGQRAAAIMHDFGLSPDDFTQKGRGVGGYLVKLSERHDLSPNKYVLEACEDVSKWYGKASPRASDVTQAYQAGLGDIAAQAVEFQEQMRSNIATAKLISKQLNVLGILSDLKKHVQEYSRNQNLFLISEAGGFLRAIIDKSDAPFVYERVGNFYQHFMIDEFQDTSAIQWGNFYPLIANSLSSGNADWVVGDVKQSIYRWRNTDWKILSEQVERDVSIPLGREIINKQPLTDNWRSSPEVIRFNNAFFRDAVSHICLAFESDETAETDGAVVTRLLADARKAYADSYQYLPEKRKTATTGYVQLRMFQDEKDAATWKEQVLEQLPSCIEQLQDKGYSLRDIAILVRSNMDAQAVASALMRYSQEHPDSKYCYDVLSNESLLIRHSSSVRWLTAAMTFIVSPADSLNKAVLQHEHQNYLQTNGQASDLTSQPDTVLQQWRSLPVYELAEKLLQDNGLYADASQVPFLQAFKDILLQYSRREATDVNSFLEWWELHRDKQFLTMPDGQDAIRLITIHKSKGLEFEAVLIPFCDWELAKDGKILWCPPSGCFLDSDSEKAIELLPLKFETELGNTIFAKEYLQEKMMSYIDNLNLLYVAFTRAKKSLFVFTGLPSEDSKRADKDNFTMVSDLLRRIFYAPFAQEPDGKEYISLAEHWQADSRSFETGELLPQQSARQSAESSVFLPAFTKRTWEYVPHIVRNSNYFTGGNATAQMDKGKLLHDIFRRIITTADLSRTLNGMISEGKFSEQEKAHLVAVVQDRVGSSPEVSRWFSKAVTVKTEADILVPDGENIRPDRIVFDGNQVQVIDYKFGNAERPAHHQQVSRYMEQLSRMGYADVKGFLWYVNLNKVTAV